jgi:hypothetical protein
MRKTSNTICDALIFVNAPAVDTPSGNAADKAARYSFKRIVPLPEQFF